MAGTVKAVMRPSSFPILTGCALGGTAPRPSTRFVEESRQPFDVAEISSRDKVSGHGTEITAAASEGISMDADTAREIIGTRFLADPSFVVSLDGTLVTFDDIPTRNIKKVNVDVPGFGAVVQLVMIDSQKADRTTRQHGIAWRVNSRLVGNPGWVGFDHERILDGRSTEAERFQFIVSADIFESAVQTGLEWVPSQ